MLLVRLWTISVLLEPLLYFVLVDRTQIGFGGNISRLLQLLVMILIIANFMSGKRFRIPVYARSLYFPLLLFIFYVFITSLVGFLLGAYSGGQTSGEQKGLTLVFHNDTTRPVVELIILIFQFFYFVILPVVFLRTKREFDFFFKWALFLLSVHFIGGWIDFILTPLGVDVISRHLGDGRSVGLRFHGIAGEPRDAAIYMMSLFFFIATYCFYKNGSIPSPKKSYTALIGVSCLATISASFFVAVFFSLLLWLAYEIRRVSVGFAFKATMLVMVLALILGYSLSYFERLGLYVETYRDYLESLYENPYQELPFLIKVSFNNVYPIIRVLREFSDGNIFPLFFGHGLGSSGIANSLIYGEYNNPNNQLARLIYEQGVVGVWLFVYVFLRITKRCAVGLSGVEKNRLVIAGLIMIAGVFAHRTGVWMIWLGLLIAVAAYRIRSNPTT